MADDPCQQLYNTRAVSQSHVSDVGVTVSEGSSSISGRKS